MRDGISGAPVNSALPYAFVVNQAAAEANFWPALAYAIFFRETIWGEVHGLWNAATIVSADGGHGLGQITPPNPIPDEWQDALVNARASITIMVAAENMWVGFEGDALIRLIADTYNAGFANAMAGHRRGDADFYTTNEYGAHVLDFYNYIVSGGDLLEAPN